LIRRPPSDRRVVRPNVLADAWFLAFWYSHFKDRKDLAQYVEYRSNVFSKEPEVDFLQQSSRLSVSKIIDPEQIGRILCLQIHAFGNEAAHHKTQNTHPPEIEGDDLAACLIAIQRVLDFWYGWRSTKLSMDRA
jgi:hypothetical protein